MRCWSSRWRSIPASRRSAMHATSSVGCGPSRMIDLLGIVGLPGAAALPCLPSERWLPDQAREVHTPALQARYLPLPFGPGPHAANNGYHVFVVGEMFRRGDYTSGPLSAQGALVYRRDSEALDTGSALLHATVNHLANDQAHLRVSFTSGFDSRVNLATLDRPPEGILA